MNPRLIGTGGQLQQRIHKECVGNNDRCSLKCVNPIFDIFLY